MIFNTASGPVKGNLRDKWFMFKMGYADSGAWSGQSTPEAITEANEYSIEFASGPASAYRLGYAAGTTAKYYQKTGIPSKFLGY